MGTREVYEEKLRSGNLYHDPTMNPGLGTPRCPRCLSLLSPNPEKGDWAISPVIHNFTMVVGSGAGGLLTAAHGFNSGGSIVQKHVKGSKWLQLFVGLPPLLLYSGAGAVLGGYALPRFSQLTVTSYYAALSVSHYAISLLTRKIEGTYCKDDEKSR